MNTILHYQVTEIDKNNTVKIKKDSVVAKSDVKKAKSQEKKIEKKDAKKDMLIICNNLFKKLQIIQ